VRRAVTGSLTESFPPARLYHEDIEELYRAFSEVADKLTLSDGRYVYDTLDELFAEAGPELRTFAISCDAPRITFSIDGGRRPSLWALNSDAASRGVAHRVREIVMCRRLRFRGWLTTSPGALHVVLALSFLVQLASGVLIAVADDIRTKIIAATAWLVTLGAMFGIVWMAGSDRSSRVFPVMRHERPGFVTRNRDALIVGSITALVGAIVGALVTLAATGLLG